MAERQILFASQLQKSIDDVDCHELVRFLKALMQQQSAKCQNPWSKYFLVIDIIRNFGNVEISSVAEFAELTRLITLMLRQVAEHGEVVAALPLYPGMTHNWNIFHVLAFYTQNNSQNAEAFFSCVRQVGFFNNREFLKEAPGGCTPLHVAAECNNRIMVEYIVSKDESQLLVARNGLTPSEIASQNNNTSISKYLKDRENSLLRRKHLHNATTELLKPPAVATVIKTGVETMLDMLRTTQQAVDPRLAVLPVVTADDELAKYLNELCKPIPFGSQNAIIYKDFLTRMGITKKSVFLNAMRYSTFADKFPDFIKTAVLRHIHNNS